MADPSAQAQPLTFSATEYNQLGLKGAKVITKIDNKFLAVVNREAAVIVSSIADSKSRKRAQPTDKHIMYYDYDESKTIALSHNIAKDTDPKKVKRENYLACFYNQGFFDKEDLENFLQINYDVYKRSIKSAIMDVEDERDKFSRVISASRKKGPISGIPRKKIINHVEFVYVDIQNYTDMIVTVFDVCSMTKENILEFIHDVTRTKSPTFYNIYYSLEDAQEEEDVEMLAHTKPSEQDSEQDSEQELMDRIDEYNAILEERQEEITSRLTQLKDEETQRILLEKDDDLRHLDAIAAKEKEAADKLDEVKAETAKQLKEAQAELDKQKKAKTKNEAYLKFIKGKASKDLDVAKEAFESAVTSRMDRINTLDEEIKLREEIIKKFADKKRGYEKGLQFGKIKELEKIIVEAQQKLVSGKYSNAEEAKAHVAELKTLLDNSKSALENSRAEVVAAASKLKQNLQDYNLKSAEAALATVKNVYYGDAEEDEEGEYSGNKFVSIAAIKKKAADEAFKDLIVNYDTVNNWLCMFYSKYTKNKNVDFFKDAAFSETQVDAIFKIMELNEEEVDAAEQLKVLVEMNVVMKQHAKVLADQFISKLREITEKLNTLAKKEEEAKELRQTCPLGYERTENWCFNEKLLEKLKEGYSKVKRVKEYNAAAAAAAAAEEARKTKEDKPKGDKPQTPEEAAAAAAAAAAQAEAQRLAEELKKTPYEVHQARIAAKAAAAAAKAEAAAAAAAAKASEKPKFELTPELTAQLFETRLEKSLEQSKESIPAIISNISQKIFKSSRRSGIKLDEIVQQITTKYQEPITAWIQNAVSSLADFNALPKVGTPQYNKLYKQIKKLQEPINSTVKYKEDGVLVASNKEGVIEINMSTVNKLLQDMQKGVADLKELVAAATASGTAVPSGTVVADGI